MKWLVSALAVCALFTGVRSAADDIEWCYHDESCNDATWAEIAEEFCAGSRQSPINIESSEVTGNASLTDFTFENYDNDSVLKEITNTGKTVKVNFRSGVKVSGGGLPDTYDSLQFHLHWGNGTSMPGSEHTVDGHRFPMEFHIVNMKSIYEGNFSRASEDPEGLAALGFLIEERTDVDGKPDSWKALTSYLDNITTNGTLMNMTAKISLDDLLVGVDRSRYYRYMGSLTTPTCNEIVIWTVFKDTVKVSRDLIDKFSHSVRIFGDDSPFMINVYRNLQPKQAVMTQAKSSASKPVSKMGYSLGLLALGLALWRS